MEKVVVPWHFLKFQVVLEHYLMKVNREKIEFHQKELFEYEYDMNHLVLNL